MPRSIELMLEDGESLESAIRRFVQKVQQDVPSDAKQVSVETKRFQDLIEAKYTRGLSLAESAEVASLEAGFEAADQGFYGPILERARAQKSAARKRRAS